MTSSTSLRDIEHPTPKKDQSTAGDGDRSFDAASKEQKAGGKYVNHSAMAVVGYATPWTVEPGETLHLHLSAHERITQTAIIRLDTPETVEQSWSLDALEPDIGVQRMRQGSYLTVAPSGLNDLAKIESVQLEVYLTRNAGRRILMAIDDLNIGLSDGRLFVRTSETDAVFDEVLPRKTWLDLTVHLSADSVSVRMTARDALAPFALEKTVSTRDHRRPKSQLSFGWDGRENTQKLNAKYANLRITTSLGDASWSFPTKFTDEALASQGLVKGVLLECANLPTFCTTSLRWDGTTFDPKCAPDHYDAIHCHDDDMDALDWPATHRVSVPKKAEAGVYALQANYEGGSEKIVFFVRSTEVKAPIVFLVPTATYLAYADEVLPEDHFPWQCEDRGHRFAVDNNLRSLYDYHSDLSGVSICSYKKPKVTLRDDYEYPLCAAPHNLPVDLHLLKFCHSNGIAFDLITDHDLHADGIAALKGRQMVMTGSHPEYMTVEMEDALRQFAAEGGSIAYLGGNGFCCAVAMRDDLMEIRRSSLESLRTWDGWVGEQTFALTNEPGGLLRNRGRGEFSIIGGGISLMGFDRAHPFSRTEESYDVACSWLFDGVGEEEFGQDGIVLGGAAGYEVDATDHHLGTSPDTIIVATASGFNEHFVQDETRWYEGAVSERLSKRCAEMTLRRLRSGGWIFSASSVAWCGALPGDDSMNDVGRITLNLLTRLSKDDDQKD